MDSQRRLGRGPSNRITRSWYPGGRAGSRRGSGGDAIPSRSRSTCGLGTDVGYWGRVDSQGDFEEGAGFLAPFRSPGRAGRLLAASARRLLPLGAAALVGAVTALAWQSFLLAPPASPAAQPRTVTPAPAAATSAHVAGKAAAPLPPTRGGAVSMPTQEPAPTARPVPLGEGPSMPTPAAALAGPGRAGRRIQRQVLPIRALPSGVKDHPRRATGAAGRRARPVPAADPDAILRPAFM